ncbi:MAG: hypothetical protein K2P22_03490 [Lachnospiraceae bacterium]|nr:hypothetical protein [Lawsonibacter sp.]MDE6901790.1 hypothetical protein [Lachnospiraceae bacterium]
MSLVQAVICDQFALVCGEQQANLDSGGVLHNFKKVFKLNECVIIGLSGVIEDNYYLFQDYLNMDFTVKEDCADSLEEVFKTVSARHREMAEQGECDVFSLVCGWNGSGFEGKSFFVDSAGNSSITDAKPEHSMEAKLISCGDNRHYDNFLTCMKRYGFNILGLQNTFRDVLSLGVKFDDFIDTNAWFEVIKRPE